MDRLTWEYSEGGIYLDGTEISPSDFEGHVVYYGPAVDRLAAYEDTGLTPGDVKDLQALCKENGLAKYVDLIVEAKRSMGISNEHSIEQAERIEQLEAELSDEKITSQSLRNAANGYKDEAARLRAERDKAVEDINLVFGRVRALADCDGYHPYENVCDLCAFFDGGEKRECRGNCKNARWRETEGKA